MATDLIIKLKRAFIANVKPAFYLQLVAVGVGLSYFYVPATSPFFTALANLKMDYGIWYSIVSTSLFGGLLPYLLMLASKQIHFKPFVHLIFYCVLWAFMGLIIDTFYQFQSVLFGDNNHVSTIIKKVLLDQFVFSVIITSPLLTLCFLFRDSQFVLKQWIKRINKQVLIEQIPATIVSTWIVWIPAVSVIYTMPSVLQVPLFNIVLCMFVLILALVNKPTEE